MKNFNHISVSYDVLLGERITLRIGFTDRKDRLGLGNPTLCYNMRKIIGAFKDKVTMIDGAPINIDGLTPRNLGNFLNGRKTQLPTLYAIKAYLMIVEQLEADQ